MTPHGFQLKFTEVLDCCRLSALTPLRDSGSVHLDEFIEYYQDVSASIDNDDYFELMIRNAWHISGGEGQYENTANLRVLVIHDDGSQEVVEIQDDLGLDVNDFPAIRKKLFMQGVKNIKKVEVASAM